MPERIEIHDGKLNVPDEPIIPFIVGDGIGPDVWAASKLVIDSAVRKSYPSHREIAWKEVLAGETAHSATGSWLPDETIEAFKDHLVGIKGPLTTPVGGGIRSLNVALRQTLDLFVCLRPVRWFKGVPSPVLHPENVDMVVFRENTEDLYAGFEVESSTADAAALAEFCRDKHSWKIRGDAGIGIKPISKFASQRLVRAAILYAIANNRKSVTLVHKGNIMKFTEGAFMKWGYEIAGNEFGARRIGDDPWHSIKTNGREILIKDVIADNFFQESLTRPEVFDVIATTNLNGDYISDALAAQVGGIGISPGANINYDTGIAVFEATHGTAPTLAGRNKANPCSLILSGAMLLRYIGWKEPADMIVSAIEKTIMQKKVTFDLECLMKDAVKLGTREFAAEVVRNL